MTTIVSVRRNGKVVVGGDGQVSLGNTVMKGNARKVRRLYNGKVLAGLAKRIDKEAACTALVSQSSVEEFIAAHAQ